MNRQKERRAGEEPPPQPHGNTHTHTCARAEANNCYRGPDLCSKSASLFFLERERTEEQLLAR